jgi:hypothetical protein
VDQIEAKKHLADVVNVLQFAVKVLALQQLAQLVEDQKCVSGVRLFERQSRRTGRSWSGNFFVSGLGVLQKLDVPLLALE